VRRDGSKRYSMRVCTDRISAHRPWTALIPNEPPRSLSAPRTRGSPMRRRDLLTLLGGAAVSWPVGMSAQHALPVIGYLSARSPESDTSFLAAFRQGLNEAGYTEGKNVAVEFRWAGARYDQLASLAEELVRQNVALIVGVGGPLPAQAARAATTSIPILFVGGDPIKDGLVASLNHPGSNVTGVVSFLDQLAAKQLGLLRDLVPNAHTVALLVNPNETTTEAQVRDVQAAARELSQNIIVLAAATEGDIEACFATLKQERASTLIVGAGAFFVTRADKIIELAAQHAVPTMYSRRGWAAAGGLMSYGSSPTETYRQLGIYAGRILKGVRSPPICQLCNQPSSSSSSISRLQRRWPSPSRRV
jgi:putative tryptophan/tyrosine transport system substrate-binding protein